jgi:hypothetical protein
MALIGLRVILKQLCMLNHNQTTNKITFAKMNYVTWKRFMCDGSFPAWLTWQNLFSKIFFNIFNNEQVFRFMIKVSGENKLKSLD